MDAVDTALVDIDEDKIELIDFFEYPIPDRIRTPLREINEETPLRDVAMMDVTIGELFAEAANALLVKNKLTHKDIRAIGSHGQTVFHSPNSSPPCTVQIGDPNVIASRTGITTVADFRRMDVANGGQGAPLAPLFHKAYFQTDHPRVILNIGGIANITVLTDNPDDPVTGFDTGPGNCLMDDWIFKYKGVKYDENGDWARTGTVNEELLARLLDDAYFKLSPPKSTGRDDFNLEWLEQKFMSQEGLKPEDVQATLLTLTTSTISAAIKGQKNKPEEVYVCGGGVNNDYLLEKLQLQLPNVQVSTTEHAGINASAIEACCFAWFAYMNMNSQSLNLKLLTNGSTTTKLGSVSKA